MDEVIHPSVTRWTSATMRGWWKNPAGSPGLTTSAANASARQKWANAK